MRQRAALELSGVGKAAASRNGGAAAELIASSMGLGFLLIDSQNTGRTDVMLLAIILLAVLGKLSDALLALGEDRLLAARR